jgi:hypothetical protein
MPVLESMRNKGTDRVINMLPLERKPLLSYLRAQHPNVDLWQLEDLTLKFASAAISYYRNRYNGKLPPDFHPGHPSSVRVMREAGFPHDGTYEWDKPDEAMSHICYREGPHDRDFMEQQDRVCLAELERSKQSQAPK